MLYIYIYIYIYISNIYTHVYTIVRSGRSCGWSGNPLGSQLMRSPFRNSDTCDQMRSDSMWINDQNVRPRQAVSVHFLQRQATGSHLRSLHSLVSGAVSQEWLKAPRTCPRVHHSPYIHTVHQYIRTSKDHIAHNEWLKSLARNYSPAFVDYSSVKSIALKIA